MNQLVASIVSGVVTIGLTVLIQALGAARMQGNFGARLDGTEKRLDSLEAEQDSQWKKINEHGERISHMEGPKVRANGGVH